MLMTFCTIKEVVYRRIPAYMNIQTRKKSKKSALIVVVVAVVLLAGGAVYAYTKNLLLFQKQDTETAQADKKESDVNYEAPSSDQSSAGVDAKKDFIDKKYNTSDETPSKSAASIAITSVNGSADRVSVRAMVNTNDAAGECTVTATGGGTPVEMTAGLQSQGAYSVCKGFDLVLAKGKWTIAIEYKDAAGASSKDQKEYEVK